MGQFIAIINWQHKAINEQHHIYLQNLNQLHIHQPASHVLLAHDDRVQIFSDDGLWILFNGHLDVITDSTQSDAKTIFQNYLHDRTYFATRLNGHFACIIWDHQAQTLVALRDVFGVKRLYTYSDSDQSIIANDLGTLHKLLPTKPTLNEKLIKAHLQGNGQYWQTESVYTEIQPIPPRYIQRIQANSTTSTPYFNWGKHDDLPPNHTQNEYKHRFNSSLSYSLIAQAQHSKNLGIMVSGGLDSSAIAAVLYRYRERIDPDVSLFSTVTDRFKKADEYEYLSIIAEACADWHLYTHNLDSFDFEALSASYSEPISAFSYAMLQERFLFAKAQGIDTIYYGSGGDMVMLQNAPNQIGLWLALPFVQKTQELPNFVRASQGILPFAKRLYRHYRKPPPHSYIDYIRNPIQIEHDTQFRHLTAVEQAILEPLYGDFTHALAMLDNLSDAIGMTVRLPYLHMSLITMMTQIPASEHIAKGWGRVLQRRALKGILPEAIRQRWTKAIADELLTLYLSQERLENLVSNSHLIAMGWVDADTLIQTIHEFHAGNTQYLMPLMRFDEIECWLQSHHD